MYYVQLHIVRLRKICGFFYAKETIMPFIQRYSDVKKGAIVFTGNTLALSKIANAFNLGSKP